MNLGSMTNSLMIAMLSVAYYFWFVGIWHFVVVVVVVVGTSLFISLNVVNVVCRPS
jgi:hypothetical protein